MQRESGYKLYLVGYWGGGNEKKKVRKRRWRDTEREGWRERKRQQPPLQKTGGERGKEREVAQAEAEAGSGWGLSLNWSGYPGERPSDHIPVM